MPKLDRRTFVVLSSATLGACAAQPMSRKSRHTCAIVAPRIDYLDRPLGLENKQPRFSWRLESPERGIHQVAYRITVASNQDALLTNHPDVWDSGRVDSQQCFEIAYQGPTLTSRQRCWWRVQVWSSTRSEPQTSAVTWWEMGLLNATDWNADWLAAEDDVSRADRETGLHWIWGPKPVVKAAQKFRFRFELATGIRAATLLLSGKDELHEVWVNGRMQTLPPNPYWGAMLRLTITELQPGANLLAIAAAAPPSLNAGGALAAILTIQLNDGRVMRLVTGNDWKTSATNDVTWHALQYDDSAWQAALTPKAIPAAQPWPVAPAMLLRRDFTTSRPILLARLYATALGNYEARLNGQRVGDAYLTPEPTDPSKRVLYQIYDVTKLIRTGANTIGAWLGDGWYASQFTTAGRYNFGPPPRRWRAQLELIYHDGSTERIASDGSQWRIAASPIVSAEIYNGESYDARLEQPGWDAPGFDDSTWTQAMQADAPTIPLAAQAGPKIRPMLTLQPIKRTSPRAHVYVYDFGQNFAGWVRLKVRGSAGATVRLRFAEVLTASGEIDQVNLRTATATDTYILRGDRDGETYEPRFTYHGFRYVEVSGYPGEPTADALLGIVVHSDLPIAGRLRIASPLIMQIWRNAVWSQRSNFVGLPTDCPQRDERLGWMGDAQVFWDAAAFNMDIDGFTRRFMDDVRAAQRADGAFPDVIPPFRAVMPSGSPGWGDGGVILPWTSFQRYGDTHIVDENWQAMTRWSQYVLQANPDFVWRKKRGSDYGDWLSVDAVSFGDVTTPKDLISTAFWAYSTELMRQMAQHTGRTTEAAYYAQLRADITQAFIDSFVKSDGTVGNGSQTGYVLALHFGLLPSALRSAAANRLVEDIRRRGMKLSTGFLGTPYLLDALADSGHSDVACSLLLQTQYPSWGYMVSKGATSMWERWNGDTGDMAMNSYNHYAFGAVAGFMFRRLAGIDALAPGFTEIKVAPVFDPRLEYSGGDYDSVLGRIATDWRRAKNGSLTLRVTVPPNARAVVHLPASSTASVTESRRVLDGRTDLRPIERNADWVVVAVGSGTFHFAVEP